MPIKGLLDSAYYALLSRKLFITSANLARVVDLPSGASEISIALYTKPTKGSDDAFITYTRPDKELWYAGSDEQFHFTKDPSVNITRIDALFSKSIAKAVSEGIKRMLEQIRPPTKSNLVIVDGREIEFSVDDPKGEHNRGVLTPYARGKNGTALRRLTNLLEAYCVAKPLDRPAVAKNIETEALRLGK